MTTSNVFGFPLLSLVIFMPLIAAVGVAFIPRRNASVIRGATLVFTIVVFLVSLLFYADFDWTARGFQFVDVIAWLPQLGISYLVGLDGISMPLVILTTLLTAIAVSAAWPVETRVKEFMICMLILETGMLGVFAGLDLFLFFVFFEAALIPMYLLIGAWGGPRRIYAAVKFIIYTMAGSAFLLIAIIALAVVHNSLTGKLTFSLLELIGTPVGGTLGTVLFLAFAFAFAIKVPLFPLHTWLPDAHVEAPTAGSIILAGVLLKMGTYGLLRFNLTLFPDASANLAWLMAAVAIIGIIYGAWVAFAQRDVKSLVAYSSISHMGFIVLGIFALRDVGVQGAVLYMVNHGISTGALFLLVGYIYERRHTRDLDAFGGLWKIMPLYGILFIITTFASAGLPGLNGFVGEFLTMQGAFLHNPMWAVFAALGVILSAIYLLRMFQGMFFGPVTHEENRHLAGLSSREVLTALPLVIAMFVLGIFPNLVLGPMQVSVAQVLDIVGRAVAMAH
ncbi:MAG: NADH-quinone oxidoreductase subunit M [Anaerolineae bacterium]